MKAKGFLEGVEEMKVSCTREQRSKSMAGDVGKCCGLNADPG